MWRAIEGIMVRNVSEHLSKSSDQIKNKMDVKLLTNSKDSSGQLYEIEKLLLKNQDIRSYLDDVHFRNPVLAITIVYNNDRHKIELDEFNEKIWKKCLKEVNENLEVNQMKKSVDALRDEAWYLISKITETS